MAKTEIVSRISNLVYRVKGWIRRNRLETLILLTILLIGAFFRLYKIDEYMTFLGDEGRDVIVVGRLLTDFDPILVGPGTSIGNMYLGPLYYYMMAPALLLANFSPVGPAVMIALLGVATIFFVWFVTREWFYKEGLEPERVAWGALIAAGLYAISPTVIIYSRSSWNPNIMPFFALLSIYSVWQFWEKHKFKWLVVSGISMAFALQSHYLGLLLIPVIGLFWLLTFIKVKGKAHVVKELIKNTIYGGLVFLLLMSPLIIFDARHEWRNFEAAKIFFTQRQTTISARPWTALPEIPDIFIKMVTRLVAGTSEFAGSIYSKVLTLLVGGSFLLAYFKSNFSKDPAARQRIKAYLLIFVWLGVALVGLGVYKQEIYDHYYGFFFSAPFLLIGVLIQEIFALGSKSISFPTFFGISIILYFLISVNLHNNPLRYPPNRQLQRTIEVVKAVTQYSEGKPFNFAVIAERNYEGAYMYFFEMWGIPAYIPIADILDETLKDQLFVVCEVTGERCNPETNVRPELTNFGWRKVVASWEVAGFTIHKVIHAQ